MGGTEDCTGSHKIKRYIALKKTSWKGTFERRNLVLHKNVDNGGMRPWEVRVNRGFLYRISAMESDNTFRHVAFSYSKNNKEFRYAPFVHELKFHQHI